MSLPWGESYDPNVAPTSVIYYTMMNSDTPMKWITWPWCHSCVFRIRHGRYKGCLVTLPLGKSHKTQMSLWCMQNEMQTNHMFAPMGSIIWSKCRSNACKIQCKLWVIALTWVGSYDADVAWMQIVTPTHLKYWKKTMNAYLSWGEPHIRSDTCKKGIVIPPWGESHNSDTAPMRAKYDSNDDPLSLSLSLWVRCRCNACRIVHHAPMRAEYNANDE